MEGRNLVTPSTTKGLSTDTGCFSLSFPPLGVVTPKKELAGYLFRDNTGRNTLAQADKQAEKALKKAGIVTMVFLKMF